MLDSPTLGREVSTAKPAAAKLLVVSASVFPKRSASAFVTEKLAMQFSETEMVIIGERPKMGRIAMNRPTHAPKVFYFRSRFALAGRGARFFSRLRWLLLPLLVKRICKIARQERCDHILGVYPDEMYCYAAHQAAMKLKLPFFTYFHNTYLDNDAINKSRASVIQPRLFDASEKIFVISDGMKRFLDAKYGSGKFVSLLHTFEHSPAPESPAVASGRNEVLKLILYGNFNASNQDATGRVITAVRGNKSFEAHLFTDVPRLLLRQRGIDANSVHLHAPLGHLSFDDMLRTLREYDVMILTHGLTGGYGDVEYRTIFPTRTIPMLLSGRPILLHSPATAFLTEFFRKYNCGVVVDEPSESKIVEGLLALREDDVLRNTVVENARLAAAQFHGPTVAQTLRTHIFDGAALRK